MWEVGGGGGGRGTAEDAVGGVLTAGSCQPVESKDGFTPEDSLKRTLFARSLIQEAVALSKAFSPQLGFIYELLTLAPVPLQETSTQGTPDLYIRVLKAGKSPTEVALWDFSTFQDRLKFMRQALQASSLRSDRPWVDTESTAAALGLYPDVFVPSSLPKFCPQDMRKATVVVFTDSLPWHSSMHRARRTNRAFLVILIDTDIRNLTCRLGQDAEAPTRRLSWPRVGNHSEYWIVGDEWGWTSRLAVQEGSSKDPVMLVWTSFLAAPFGEAIPWPTLLGEPSGLASMARP
ncbi:hypothetical protein AK812_SmicGene40945 [Symbiodinium microadriaticum]|uniref:Uncharacterized protein n=1 Tax=Symbiodinium microadriaticum TaxID=2951 RepID=A0A1Q9C7E6_SYMMI|nr:hypothetical protein AK812_SmicGene40945 [Symbiodinium microadriaticum]